MLGVKAFSCPDYIAQFLSSDLAPLPPQPRGPQIAQPPFYELASFYFVYEGCPMIFNLLHCRDSFMHHMDLKYQTLDTTFDKG